KNLKMLEMIVRTSSNPDDLVLDCFAGSGTTLVAAELHGRRWIGVDSSALAIQATRRRLLHYSRGCRFTTLRAMSLARV
ncbi:MAG: site-specific DNA-methyltransferase, partial [Acidobacteria bacterium]|nr:site-specific DNA-methyltransferase [Acidobacteriota bacterium]